MSCSEILFKSLVGNPMKLDGGAMFGNAPKALWSRWMPSDDRNMIEIASRILLVQAPGANILFETGAGAYLSPEMKKRFQVKGRGHILLDNLEEQGLGPGDITHVVLSHLHFDHAGGLLKAYEKVRDNFELVFPNARFIVGEKNFDRSAHPHIRDRASFIPELTGLLKASNRLDLKKGGDRIRISGVEILFHESHGHTPGMLVSWIRAKDICMVFAGDLVPAHPWVNLPITMGYDRFPEGLINEKKIMLERAYGEKALVFYPHDPVCAASGLCLDPGKNRITAHGLIENLDMAV